MLLGTADLASVTGETSDFVQPEPRIKKEQTSTHASSFAFVLIFFITLILCVENSKPIHKSGLVARQLPAG